LSEDNNKTTAALGRAFGVEHSGRFGAKRGGPAKEEKGGSRRLVVACDEETGSGTGCVCLGVVNGSSTKLESLD
jgi:hypothetical protein